MSDVATLKRDFARRGIAFESAPGDLTTAVLEHAGSMVRVCTRGAHVLAYHPHDQPPVLWLSPDAIFAPAKAIRGGIPICWPWFADHPSAPALPAHGFARITDWTIVGAESNDREKALTLALRDSAATRELWPHPFELRYRVSLSGVLRASLSVTNTGAASMSFSGALHSYFDIADIAQVALEGLEKCSYLDKLDENRRKLQHEALLRVRAEVDRTYLDTENVCTIHDARRARRIIVDKSGSRTTVVWNPWQDRARSLVDFPDDGYRSMLCVESANTADDVVNLAPGAEHTLSVAIESIAGGVKD